jgi:hypothetical protein
MTANVFMDEKFSIEITNRDGSEPRWLSDRSGDKWQGSESEACKIVGLAAGLAATSTYRIVPTKPKTEAVA